MVVYLAYLIVRLAVQVLGSGHVNFVAVIWILIWTHYYIWRLLSFRNSQVSCSDVAAMFKGVKKLYGAMSGA